MKYFTFYDESNDFKELLKDPSIKKHISTSLQWGEHLTLGFYSDTEDGVFAYLILKYGEKIVKRLDFDYTPVPGKDYVPQRKKASS